MGMDLIIASAVIDKKREPDFDAMEARIRTLTLDEVGEDLAFLYDDEEDMRDSLSARCDDLRDSWHMGFRDGVVLSVRDAYVFIGGGSSWGDSPGPTFDALNDLSQVPGLMALGGFDE
jgi:hypothetical protein